MAPQDDMKVGGVGGRQFFNVNAIAPITYGMTTSHVVPSDSATRTSFAGTVSQLGLYSPESQSNVGLNPFKFGTGFISGNYAFNDDGEYVPVARCEAIELIG